MPFWSWLLLGLGAVAVLIWVLSRPIYRRHRTLADVRRLVDSFLRGMDTGAVWFAQREGGPGFLQLALVSNQTLQQIVQLGLPDVDWSRDRFDAVMAAVQTAGFTIELETSSGPVRRFLRVSCTGLRPELTDECMRLLAVVEETLGWKGRQTYTVHWGGTPPGPQSWRELLDASERMPDSGMTRWMRRYASRQLGRRDK